MFSEKFKEKIEEIYEARKAAVPECFSRIEQEMETCSREEQILLHYLYGNMPLSDMLNYSFITFLDYARHGVFLWENGIFKGRISEEIFCQYIVYHRINTEDISPCRSFFYEKVKAEVSAESTMEEACLSLNYWCAQEVTYRASDDRTVSPMTAYTSAHGRCGEESTFTVSVLRSMGIPARQVYAPRWSHCDDNHAWVEAWCDGKWYFMGACEPEEVLNKGWFLHASSRAMLIHSRWYGSLALAGDAVSVADIVSSQGMTTEINEISSYANTSRVKIHVQNPEGIPVQGAQVRIEVLNYSEFFPIAVLQTDAGGNAEIELGLGSCRVYASSGNLQCAQIIDVRECKELTLIVTCCGQTDEPENGPDRGKSTLQEWHAFESFAPQDAIIHRGFVTEEQKKIQKEKIAERTAIRLKKVGTGNEAEAEAFLGNGAGEVPSRARYREQLLGTLTEKDFLDLKADVLEAHLSHAMQYEGLYPEEIFVRYILAPRISIELLTNYRQEIEVLLTEEQKAEFRKKPVQIWDYVDRTISESPKEEYEALLTFPGECLKYKSGSRQSKEILFVAICRTLGIPARLNPVDGAMEYYMETGFTKVLETEAEGRLHIHTVGTESFVYLQNWSVSRKYPGGRKLMDLSGLKTDGDAEAILPAGTYEAVTSNRLPNGNVLGRICEFIVVKGGTTDIELMLEEAALDQMLECVPMPPFDVTGSDGQKKEIGKELEGRAHLVIWLAEGQEPSEHILNELCERADEFHNKEAGIVFLVNGKEALNQPTLHRTMQQLDGIKVLYDSVEERVSVLGRRFYVDPENMPLILVTDKEANCVYATSGYNVGTADMILKILDAGII